MAISVRMEVFREEMLAFLAETIASLLKLSTTLRPEAALELRMALIDLLREAERVSQRAQTDDECLAAMRTAGTMLHLMADDRDAAAIERAKISTPPSPGDDRALQAQLRQRVGTSAVPVRRVAAWLANYPLFG